MEVPTFRHQQSRFDLIADEFLVWAGWYTPEELGLRFRQIVDACNRRDFKFLRQFKFVGRIYKGYQGRELIPIAIRKRVLSVGKCKQCGATEKLTIDHIKPVSRGGSNKLRNLQCLCAACNRKKGPERGCRI